MEDDNFDKLYLIDVSGFIFRAYHSFPYMSSLRGEPVNAIYGMSRMLMGMSSIFKSEYTAAVCDVSKKTYRSNIYAEYKMNRPPLPSALEKQMGLVRTTLEAFGLPIAERVNYEADDVIATLATQASSDGIKVTIISSDKDLMQLVDDNISLYDPIKKRTIGHSEVLEKFGVIPELVVDVQSLAGDSVDNVPGIQGIGIKTASKLVNEYGNLDKLLENAHQIKQTRRRESLLSGKNDALVSRELVKLCREVPLDYHYSDLRANFEVDRVRGFCLDFGFNSLIKKMSNGSNGEFQRSNGSSKEIVSSVSKNDSLNIKEMAKVLGSKRGNYRVISSESELKAVVSNIKSSRLLSLDCKSDGLDVLNSSIVGIGLSWQVGEGVYIPLGHRSGVNSDLLDFSAGDDIPDSLSENMDISLVRDYLGELLSDSDIIKIGHNIKLDKHILGNIKNGGMSIYPYDDIMILSHLLDGIEEGNSLEKLCKDWFNYDRQTYKELLSNGSNKANNISYVDLNKVSLYSCEGSDYKLRLYKLLKFRIGLEGQAKVYEKFERPLLEVLYNMEQAGVKLDRKVLQELGNDIRLRLNDIKDEIKLKIISELSSKPNSVFDIEHLNINSSLQVGSLFFDELRYPYGKKTSKGNWQTNEDILRKLSKEGYELASLMLKYRELEKLNSTYVVGLLKKSSFNVSDRLHTSFNMSSTITGRLSSSEPNMQNIPIRSELGRKIRECFVADEGYNLVSIDYSQIELRIFAHVAGIDSLKEAFNNGIDIHRLTASQAFNVSIDEVDDYMRRKAKAINFGIIYGMKSYGLARQLDISVGEAKSYIELYFRQFPGIEDYIKRQEEQARSGGYVETFCGRRCYFPNNNRGYLGRLAINAPIQGGGADIIKLAMIRIHDLLEKRKSDWDSRLLLQVHDELVFEVPDNKVDEVSNILKLEMEGIGDILGLSVKLVAEYGYGKNWSLAH